MKPLRRRKPIPKGTEADLAAAEADMVFWAELRAEEIGAAVEAVLTTAFDYSANSGTGEAPLEVLRDHPWRAREV